MPSLFGCVVDQPAVFVKSSVWNASDSGSSVRAALSSFSTLRLNRQLRTIRGADGARTETWPAPSNLRRPRCCRLECVRHCGREPTQGRSNADRSTRHSGYWPTHRHEWASRSCCALHLVWSSALDVATTTRSRLAGVLQWRPLASVGLISYSLFLFERAGGSLVERARRDVYRRPRLELNILLVAGISVSLAMSYLLVERPFIAVRRRAPCPRTAIPALAPADAA